MNDTEFEEIIAHDQEPMDAEQVEALLFYLNDLLGWDPEKILKLIEKEKKADEKNYIQG